MIEKMIVSKSSKRKRKIQTYQCENGHFFKARIRNQWSDSFIEYVVYVYLRCLSLNTAIDVVRVTYEEDLLSKKLILTFIEQVADPLPGLDDIDRIFEPTRSGYLAFDGVWFNFQDEEVVLLVCFDPETFDVIGALWHEQEDQAGYDQLMCQVLRKLPKVSIKGAYGDGDNGLIASLKLNLPDVPFQVCVAHKEMRMGQFVPVKSVHRSRQLTAPVKEQILKFQELFRAVIYADNEPASYQALEKLKVFVQRVRGPNAMRFGKAYRSLNRNFEFTLTHFRYPRMARDNNLIECFNGCIKPRINLMKSFKKKENLNRYLKLFLLEFRFRPLRESRFKDRRGKSPLELGGVYLEKYWNFLTFLRTHFKLSYQPKIS